MSIIFYRRIIFKKTAGSGRTVPTGSKCGAGYQERMRCNAAAAFRIAVSAWGTRRRLFRPWVARRDGRVSRAAERNAGPGTRSACGRCFDVEPVETRDTNETRKTRIFSSGYFFYYYFLLKFRPKKKIK